MPIANRRKRILIGIDPGKSGGIAWGTKYELMGCVSMPKTEPDVCDFILAISKIGDASCILEKVGSRPGNSARSMFTFGEGFGVLKSALYFAGVRTELCVPGKWMRALGIPKKKKTETKGQYKNRLKQRSQQLFPKERVTLDTADALLIYEYHRNIIG